MNEPSLILIVEDERKIAELLHDYARRAGYRARVVDHGDAVLEAMHAQQPDLVLLDLMLPGTDGMTLCRRIRAVSSIPIIMVTARADEVDRLLGLEIGADDYVTKPFSPREVMARVKAQLRRGELLQRSAETPAPLDIRPDELRVYVGGRPVELTPVEFRILERLASRPARVFSREQLMDAAYTDHRVVSDRTIDTHVKNLRRKLAGALDTGSAPIASVYGVGYRLDA